MSFSQKASANYGPTAMQPSEMQAVADRASRFFQAGLELRAFLKERPDDALQNFLHFCMANCRYSHAQLFQDLLVLFLLGGKHGGYFVEFGATDGMSLSNTLLLESNFGWSGLLAEPARCWHNALRANRKAAIDFRCVWSESGKVLTFNETEIAELSTIDDLSGADMHRELRQTGVRYDVETVSLDDLLVAHRSPRVIDYLSVDTEGSEFDILNNFAFDRYDVAVITVEHNFVEATRSKIVQLLAGRGFTRVLDFLSNWDDWYVKTSLISSRR